MCSVVHLGHSMFQQCVYIFTFRSAKPAVMVTTISLSYLPAKKPHSPAAFSHTVLKMLSFAYQLEAKPLRRVCTWEMAVGIIKSQQSSLTPPLNHIRTGETFIQEVLCEVKYSFYTRFAV